MATRAPDAGSRKPLFGEGWTTSGLVIGKTGSQAGYLELRGNPDDAAAIVLAGAGVTYAATDVFDHNQVGTEYANGIQVSDDQVIQPLGERLQTQLGKFMGSRVSPDGHFLAATSTDRSVALQIFDLQSYKLIWSAGSARTCRSTRAWARPSRSGTARTAPPRR